MMSVEDLQYDDQANYRSAFRRLQGVLNSPTATSDDLERAVTACDTAQTIALRRCSQ